MTDDAFSNDNGPATHVAPAVFTLCCLHSPDRWVWLCGPPHQNPPAVGSLSEALVLLKTLSGALCAQSPKRNEHG